MVRVLNQLGFIVDVVDYRDEGFAPSQRYDLFIGHGGINYVKIAGRLHASATKIYFSTGCYWKFHNEQELARFSALRERRGVTLPPDRLITTSEEEALLAADGIVGIGNDFTKNTYVGYSPITMINGTSLFDDHYDQHDKNFDKGREHFLYFARSGNVHKGLDLLLEAFADLRQHLWICSKIDQGFADVYSKELHDLPNIHLVSWVQERFAKFYEMMDTCNFVILPSCSEGQAQSVVKCMNQGLIPIVSSACGLAVGGYGVSLTPCTIEQIARVLPMLASTSATSCRKMSLEVRKVAALDFSESAFTYSFTEAIRYYIAQTEPSKRRQ